MAKHYNLAGERVGSSEAPPPAPEPRSQEAKKKSPVGIELIIPQFMFWGLGSLRTFMKKLCMKNENKNMKNLQF